MGYMTPGQSGMMNEPGTPAPPAKPKPRGLGDLVAAAFKAVGIEIIVRKATKGKDCGCRRRQEKLNKLVPFKRGEENASS